MQLSDAMWRLAARAVAARFSALEAQGDQSDRVQLPRETPAPAIRITELDGEWNSLRSPLYFVRRLLNTAAEALTARAVVNGASTLCRSPFVFVPSVPPL